MNSSDDDDDGGGGGVVGDKEFLRVMMKVVERRLSSYTRNAGCVLVCRSNSQSSPGLTDRLPERLIWRNAPPILVRIRTHT